MVTGCMSWCSLTFNAGGKKRTDVLKQTWKSNFKVSVSVCELLLSPGVKGLKGVLEILRNNQIKSEAFRQLCSLKALLKIFEKFIGSHLQLNAYC